MPTEDSVRDAEASAERASQRAEAGRKYSLAMERAIKEYSDALKEDPDPSSIVVLAEAPYSDIASSLKSKSYIHGQWTFLGSQKSEVEVHNIIKTTDFIAKLASEISCVLKTRVIHVLEVRDESVIFEVGAVITDLSLLLKSEFKLKLVGTSLLDRLDPGPAAPLSKCVVRFSKCRPLHLVKEYNASTEDLKDIAESVIAHGLSPVSFADIEAKELVAEYVVREFTGDPESPRRVQVLSPVWKDELGATKSVVLPSSLSSLPTI